MWLNKYHASYFYTHLKAHENLLQNEMGGIYQVTGVAFIESQVTRKMSHNHYETHFSLSTNTYARSHKERTFGFKGHVCVCV